MVWYLSTLVFVAYSVDRGLLMLCAKRGDRDFDNSASFRDRAFDSCLYVTKPPCVNLNLANTTPSVDSSSSVGACIISLSSS